MRPQLLMGAVGIFIIGTLLACLASGRWLLNGEIDIVNALASFDTMSVQAGGVWNAPKTLATYWDAIITALSWNYPFLDYAWAFPVKMILWVISLGVVFGLISLFVQIITGLVGIVRSLLPG